MNWKRRKKENIFILSLTILVLFFFFYFSHSPYNEMNSHNTLNKLKISVLWIGCILVCLYMATSNSIANADQHTYGTLDLRGFSFFNFNGLFIKFSLCFCSLFSHTKTWCFVILFIPLYIFKREKPIILYVFRWIDIISSHICAKYIAANQLYARL